MARVSGLADKRRKRVRLNFTFTESEINTLKLRRGDQIDVERKGFRFFIKKSSSKDTGGLKTVWRKRDGKTSCSFMATKVNVCEAVSGPFDMTDLRTYNRQIDGRPALEFRLDK